MPEIYTPDSSLRDYFVRYRSIASPEGRVAIIEQLRKQSPERLAEFVLLVSQPCDEGLFDPPNVAIKPAGAAHPADATSLLEVTDQLSGADDQSGEQIGTYKLLQKIGEGGFGVVYMAQQTEPVRRKVALKVIKPGMDSKEVVARFEAERQALAMMDHPNVAKVLDGGTTDNGRPFFVMELVHGTPITKFCDENRLSNRERLEIFVDVCRAVQHAHLKGIIHRDLKPSNVLVTMNDDKPMPKVIDFGVSKALSQPLTDKTMFTAFGQMVGTPLYMSPEQAQFSAHDVDVRSDVYSLGVLLYELLTGSTPFDRETLQKAGLDEMRRLIREVEPARPSARISTLRAEMISTVADRRHAEVRKLSHSLQGELDWIVMKALEKDRSRRYQSATAFADDIQRYLVDEQVEACPPSVAYRLRKYARRHKSLLTIVALAITMLTTSTAVSGVFAVQANRAQAAANQAAQTAGEQRDEALAAQQLADARLAQSQADVSRALSALQIVVDAVSTPEFGELPVADKVRETTFNQAMQFYEEIAKEHDNHPLARLQRAAAHGHLTLISEHKGDPAKRREHAAARLAIMETLCREQPDNVQFRKELVQAIFSRYHADGLSDEQRLSLAERMLNLHLRNVESGHSLLSGFSALLHIKLAEVLPLESDRTGQLIAEARRIGETIGVSIVGVLAFEAKWAAARGDVDAAIENLDQAASMTYERASNLPLPYVELILSHRYQREVAQLEEQRENFGNAERAYLKAIEIVSEAADRYSKVQWVRDELSAAVQLYIKMLEGRDRRSEGAEYFRTLVDKYPDFEELHDQNARRLKQGIDPVAGLSAAIEGYPEREAYYLNRATHHAEAGNWSAAHDDYDVGFSLGEDPSAFMHYQAALFGLAADDKQGFKSSCAEILQKFQPSEEPSDVNFICAWTCALAPDAIDDYEQAIKLARHAVAKDAGNQQYLDGLGAILMRAGRYDEAKEQLEKAFEAEVDDKTSTSYRHYFLAMTEHHRGNKEAAVIQLQIANESLEKELSGSPTWNRKLTLETLRKEAEALLGPAPSRGQEVESPQPSVANPGSDRE